MIALVSCGDRDGQVKGVSEHTLEGRTMGTSWSLRYEGSAVDGLEGKIVNRLEQLEEVFSTWRGDSVVSRINRGVAVELPADYTRVLELAREIQTQSGGAFDVEVGDYVRMAGFSSELGGRLDFSAIAKGYAVDEIGHLLEVEGVAVFLIEIGGELLGVGRDWRVGLESPDPGSVGKVRRTIFLRDAAVATSGSYRLFRGESNHLIDPRSGGSISHDVVSVSVVAETCAEADAYATALIVLGMDEGMALAERLGLRAVFVQRLSDGEFEQSESSAWVESAQSGD